MIIDLKDFEHDKSESVYNYNFYKHKKANTSTLLLVKHTDDSHEVDLFVIGIGVEKVFLGSAVDDDTGVFDFELGCCYT